jgi:glucose-6-phosphate 1-dehydrogenase
MDLQVTIKEPGPGGMRLIDNAFGYDIVEALGDDADEVTDAYERLIMDVIRAINAVHAQ